MASLPNPTVTVTLEWAGKCPNCGHDLADAPERLLRDLHTIAKGVDHFEYGLPLYDDEAVKAMVAKVVEFAAYFRAKDIT